MLKRSELPGAIDDRLFFGQVREDPRLELTAFVDHLDEPIAVVSSGGCTALSLIAAGAREVIGIDLNRTQNHLVELKATALVRLGPIAATTFLGGHPAPAAERIRTYGRLRADLSHQAQTYWDGRRKAIAGGVLDAGATEKLTWLFATLVRWLIHPPSRIDRMLGQHTLDEQPAFYREEWNNRRWRLLLRLLFNDLIMRKTYDPAFFDTIEDPSFAQHFHRLIGHALTELPIRENYFLHHLFSGRYPDNEDGLPPYLQPTNAPATTRAADRLSLIDAGYTDYLRTLPDNTLGGFALSNICEWLTAEQIDELFAEIVRTARPGARLVFRNFVGWTDVPGNWRTVVHEDRARGDELIRLDRSFCQPRIALCDIRKEGC